MAIPKWEHFLIPCLRVLENGETLQRRVIVERAATMLGISARDRRETLQSGQRTYANRANWAISHLSKAGAIRSPMRANWEIQDTGLELLRSYPTGMTKDELLSAGSSEYRQFVTHQSVPEPVASSVVLSRQDAQTPLELVEVGRQRNEELVSEELLKRLHENDPVFFEQAVLDLLMAMGYGGSLGQATRTQLVNDGGVDGVIDQDALGLSRIYVQAKRYEMTKSIGRPDVQAFVGALHGVQANQGVFMTTATFSSGAAAYADSVQSRVVLIDGPMLAQLMIRYGVGVQVKRTVHIVEIDEDFFEQDV